MADILTEQVSNLKLTDFVITDLGDIANLKTLQGPEGPPGKDGGIDEIVDYFGKVSIIKPVNKNNIPVHLHAEFYDSPDFTGSIVFTFDTKNNVCRQNTYAFMGALSKEGNDWLNNAWMNMYDSPGTTNGLGAEFDNYPVLLDIRSFIKDNDEILNRLKETKHFYAKYVWYWMEGNVEHKSDNYSLVFPSISETTSIIQQQGNPMQNNTTTASNIVYVENSNDDLFEIYPNSITIITTALTKDTAKILLDNYSLEKTYRFQFKTGDEGFDADQLEIYYKEISGGNVRADELKRNINIALKKYQRTKANVATFNANTKYLIECQLQMVTLISSAEIEEEQENEQ